MSEQTSKNENPKVEVRYWADYRRKHHGRVENGPHRSVEDARESLLRIAANGHEPIGIKRVTTYTFEVEEPIETLDLQWTEN